MFDSFSNVTRNSLGHSLSDNGSFLAEDDKDHLLRAYDSLSPFPDVVPTLERMHCIPEVIAVVFSNGTHAMVSNSVRHSLSHSGIFRDIITVEAVQQYKPAPAVYSHLAETVGRTPSQRHDIWLISGNPFDVVGARHAGLNAIWIDRAGGGWMDAAVPSIQPTAMVTRLDGILDVIQHHCQQQTAGQACSNQSS